MKPQLTTKIGKDPLERRSRLSDNLIAAGLGLLLLGWFVKFSVLSRFDAIPGNIGDAKFILYICEHWYQVFKGQAAWLSPGMFYPEAGTLGFSDSLFLFGVVYSAFRGMGADAFSAFQIIIIGLPLVGYWGGWLLLRRSLKFALIPSLTGAGLFGFSSALYASMAHAQLEAIALVPFLVMLLKAYLSRLDSPGITRNLSGLAFFSITPLLAYTSFYTAWFCVLATAIALPILFTSRSNSATSSIRHFLLTLKTTWHNITFNLVIGVLFSIPFFVTYIPILQRFPRRPYEEVVPMLPSLIDFVNVGFENYTWGPTLQKLSPTLQTRPIYWELDKGLSLLVLGCFVAGTVLSWQILRKRHDHIAFIAWICAATVWVSWILMVKIDGHSMWRFIYRFVPGGGAIRAVYRFNICLMLPIAVCVAFFLNRWLSAAIDRRGVMELARIAGLSLAILFEQGNGHRDVLSKSDERDFMQSVPRPPDFCKAMVITAKKDPYLGWWPPIQIDAMLIAQANRIPTLNGYSGWTPNAWALHFPADPNYENAVRQWAETHRVSDDLCAFAFETKRWSSITPEGGPHQASVH